MRNYVSEKDAVKKWCPFSRLSHGDGTFNRFSRQSEELSEESLCLGKRCMAFCDCGISSADRYFCGLANGE